MSSSSSHDNLKVTHVLDSSETALSLDGVLAEANERQRAHEFCVLVGNVMWSYSDVWAYAKGDPPTAELRIVGASAWNPPILTSSTRMSRHKLVPPSAPNPRNLAAEAIPASSVTSKSGDFLIVTYSGTHVQCSAPTPRDKDNWLEALHSGLEGCLTENRINTLVVLSQLHDCERTFRLTHENGEKRTSRRNCKFGAQTDMMVQSAIASALSSFEAEVSLCPFMLPLPRIAAKSGRTHLKGVSLHSDVNTLTLNPGSGSTSDIVLPPHRTGYCSPCDDVASPLSKFHCTACGRYPPDLAMRIDAAPLPEHGVEVRVDLCHDCSVAQGVLQQSRHLSLLYEAEACDRATVRMAWFNLKDFLNRQEPNSAGLQSFKPCEDKAAIHESTVSALSVPCTDEASAAALLEYVGGTNFVAYRQRSHSLESLCEVFENQGVVSASDFLMRLGECAQVAQITSFHRGAHRIGCHVSEFFLGKKEHLSTKKEAFKVAGDMSAALKLLYEYALPPDERSSHPKQDRSCICSRDNSDMLTAILEFFLDLCNGGQMEAVAFFWPQLCHIHMQMLPPRDVEEMIRVELMEDFLLTVATCYSVHLALNLVWGLIADLEESLGTSNCHSPGRWRRFAVLRFVSELESLLFDFEGGWGGGGVSLHGMLSPSQHQAGLLRDVIALLQIRRRFGSYSLTRSVRLDKLQEDALESIGLPLLVAGSTAEIVRTGRNAEYFSSHVSFARQLGDISERLRFAEPGPRAAMLRDEFKKLNCSGKILGGDPLNRLCCDGLLVKTIHIPINEGHVFRSKERTPVLLLAELVKEPAEVMVEILGQYSTCHFVGNGKFEPSLSVACSDQSLGPSDTRHVLEDSSKSEREMKDAPSNASPESLGRLSHRVLALTPKSMEVTDVTEEGKVMMADMIATLIVNQKTHEGANPLQLNPYSNQLVKGQPHLRSDDGSRRGIQSGDTRKISALGSVFPHSGCSLSSPNFSRSSGIHLTADGQFRRDVLFAIMEKGMRGSNVIAQGAATAARRAMQAIDRKRAIALMMGSTVDNENAENNVFADCEKSALGLAEESSSDITINAPIDEGEVMEALRLLIIQNQVAQENLSTSSDCQSKVTLTCSEYDEGSSHVPNQSPNGVDAGEVDSRLAGCGPISSSVLSALQLWKGSIISNGELLELVQKDLQYLKQTAIFGTSDQRKLIEDSAFWGRFSFGERWAEKKARIAASSPYGSLPRWDLIGCIVKSNDDLRQEAFVMQLICLCEEAFRTAGLDLWVHPYDIVATGLSTGIIECVRNAMSFDSLKKRPGYGTDGLLGHFQRMTEIAAEPLEAFNEAKQNFVSSLAAYSLMSYLFLFKDRHNGNLLLDTAGHLIHIDFGFVFGIAPGGSFSLEQSTPFKLTDEMLEVMGGLGSPLFSEFVTLFCCGFLALQAHADTFLTVVDVMCRGSNFNCFVGKDPEELVSKLRERFCPELTKSQTVAYALDLIKFATTSYGTKQYDYFQYLSQGIAT